MQRISYPILFYSITALFTGCSPKEVAPADVFVADKESGGDDENDNQKPAKEPEEIIELEDPVPAPEVIIPGPTVLVPISGGRLFGGGGGSGNRRASLLIEKTANVESLVAGDLITYTLTVTNNGLVTVSAIDVAETAFSGLGLTSAISCLPAEPATLSVGAQMVCTATYTVQQGDVDALSLSNTVQASGIGPNDVVVSDSDTLVLPAYIDFGDAPNTFGTLLGSDGARHSVPGYDSSTHLAPLRIGAIIDIENDGVPTVGADGDDIHNFDDEDGLVDINSNPISSISVFGGLATQVSISATNNTLTAATLAGWIDLNSSGVFDVGERQIIAVPANSGTQTYTLTFPATAVTSGNSYTRFRLFPGTVVAPSATGPAAAGEVEDHPVVLNVGLDFGDAPNTYGTSLASDGARHVPGSFNAIANTSNLSLGLLVDIEGDGFPGALATGDDLNNIDDEAGVASPIVVFSGSSTTVSVSVTNSSASAATLAGWIDFDSSGTFDADEFVTAPVPALSGVNNYLLSYPATSVIEGTTYARFRLFPGVVVAPLPTGLALAGEVEDYTVQLREILDFSDAPDVYGTSFASDGARHVPVAFDSVNRTASLMLGTGLDIESDGVPSIGADGDDLITVDDEAAVAAPIIVTSLLGTTVSVSVTNNTASVGTLAGWIDLNKNNAFDVGERVTTAIPASSGTASYNLVFPATVVTVGTTYARFRLFSGVVAAPSPVGLASSGEVEDYPVVTTVIIP